MTELLKKSKLLQTDQDTLRKNFKRMFWDVDTTRLDFEKHHKTIITQVFNYGSPEEIQALFGIYQKEAIREVLKNPIKGMWFPTTYKAFCNMLDVEPQEKAINRIFTGQKRKNPNKLFAALLWPQI
ncbi:hypothetical protein MTBBW1_2360023 [Desulfamplus magnetovallimortis]|uniref:DUF6922 domain-containing protein n=1 Tax=Desulfamplus magnetovallimortis TaxID=1246637 RepID=A0A1W1HDU1_9BACT|nr:hypothetical protein [Desulfamplus magnetovallimortis]SLM30640.1 hypothetical protein MTBBW1_2360023 [Desulfamplus magnetovallimortis]